MTDQPAATPKRSTFELEHDIVVGDKVVVAAGTEIEVRKPMGGALRGANIGGLIRMDYDQIAMVLPRVTSPILHPHLVAEMDPADITQAGGELVDFLLPKRAKDALFPSD